MSLKSSCSSLRTPHLPMPDKDALYRSFNQLLGSLDLPDDKIEEMNSYDDHKKWEILCSRSLMKVHQSPSFYLQRLRNHVGLKALQSKTDMTETLRGLEVSLRTYPIYWIRSFLGEKRALDVLVELVSDSSGNLSSECFQILTQCLKVIMIDSVGFELAINHQKLFDTLTTGLKKVSIKNRCNILQLMTLACEKSSKGHERILKSLRSNGGLQLLMDFLALDDKMQQMAIVSTISLIKALVSSPIDLNYRVYLQYEFRQIGLDNRIQRLLLNESSLTSEVIDEIKSYESMIINVNQLAKDRDEIKAGGKLMDAERQSINCESVSEVGEKDGRRRNLEDKVAEVYHRPEILQKSTVKITPALKQDVAEPKITGHNVVVVPQCPPPPPPPPMKLISIKKSFRAKCKLPAFNWRPLRPNEISGTVFNGLNDERLRKIINFTHFEDKFRIIDKSLQSRNASPQESRSRAANFETLLEPTRLRNVSIVLRKLNFDADVAIRAINDYDFNQLNLDSIELLTNLAPKDAETEAYRNYMAQKKNIVVLSDEDKFLMKLSHVERLTRKLAVMDFIGNFDDRADSLIIQLCALTSASLSLKSSRKFKSVLEIILTFGNYMNSNRTSVVAYGFRLRGTFERLTEIRSNDKKSTLLEYIVREAVAKDFPHLLDLDSELLCIDKSAKISLQSVTCEVKHIENGWRKLTEESNLSMNCTLGAFVETSCEKFNKLTNELETAQNNYDKCVCYFGEERNNFEPESDEFFSIVLKFVMQFKRFSGDGG